MSEEVYEAFKRIIENKKKSNVDSIVDECSGFLFISDKGLPLVGYQIAHKFKYAVDKHNSIYKYQLPKITPHICRHTYCSNLVKQKVSVSTIQYLMGHSSCEIALDVYTHLRVDDAKNELKKIEIDKEIRAGRARTGIAEARRELNELSKIG